MNKTRINTDTACKIAGVTYRQANYWASRGVLDVQGARGSGHKASWNREDIAILWVLGRLAILGCINDYKVAAVKALRVALPIEVEGAYLILTEWGQAEVTIHPKITTPCWVIPLAEMVGIYRSLPADGMVVRAA